MGSIAFSECVPESQLTQKKTNNHLGPSIKVKRCQLSKISLVHVDVEALTLVNIATTIHCHVYYGLLLYLPYSSAKSRSTNK
jgi:hypothetical protein